MKKSKIYLMSDQDEAALAAHPPVTPRSSLGSGALSYSSGSSISPSTSSSSSQGSAKTAVSECLGAWLNYLQVLKFLKWMQSYIKYKVTFTF